MKAAAGSPESWSACWTVAGNQRRRQLCCGGQRSCGSEGSCKAAGTGQEYTPLYSCACSMKDNDNENLDAEQTTEEAEEPLFLSRVPFTDILTF